MTITELKTLIDAAIERGIAPDTTVVVDASNFPGADLEWALIDNVVDPSVDPTYLWFTLVPGEDADWRVHPGHEGDYDF